MKIKVTGSEKNIRVTDENGRLLDNVKAVSIKYNLEKNSAQATVIVIDPIIDIEADVSTKVVKKQ